MAERLNATKVRQNSKFKERQVEWSRRLAYVDMAKVDPMALDKERATEAERAALHKNIKRTDHDSEEPAKLAADEVGQDSGQAAGPGLSR